MRRTTRARRTQVARVQGTSRPETSEQVLVAQELELRGLATEPLVPAGRTASSAVLRGVDEQGHDLVVRVLRLPPGRRGRELRQRAQVLRELETAGVVAVRAVLDLAGEYLAVVMDLVEGVDLGVLLAARGSLTRGEAATLLQEVAAGLARLHEAGIVHGTSARPTSWSRRAATASWWTSWARPRRPVRLDGRLLSRIVGVTPRWPPTSTAWQRCCVRAPRVPWPFRRVCTRWSMMP